MNKLCAAVMLLTYPLISLGVVMALLVFLHMRDNLLGPLYFFGWLAFAACVYALGGYCARNHKSRKN